MSVTKTTDSNQYYGKKSMVCIITAMLMVLIVGVSCTPPNDADHDGDTSQKTNKSTDSTEKQEADSPSQAVLTVEPIHIQVANVPVSVTAEGTLVAASEATVSGKIAGMALEQVFVNEGDWVQKGQRLATFDTQGLEQQLIQANAHMIKASTAFESAQADVARIQPLLKISAVSVQEYERYRSLAKQAEASLVAAQAELKNQKIRLNNANVVAPVAGIISKKMAAVGSVPQGGLFTIIKDGRLEWEAQVNAKDLMRIRKGTDVIIETMATQADQKTQPIFGRVVRVNPVLGSDRQAKVRVALQLPRQQSALVIQSGMLLTGRFVLGMQAQQIVPSSALVSSDGYDYLMLIDNIKQKKHNDKYVHVGTINKVKVTVGERFDAVAVITSPVMTSQQSAQQSAQQSVQQAIVGQGGSFLNDGDLVRVMQSVMKSGVPMAQAGSEIIDNTIDENVDSTVMMNETRSDAKRDTRVSTDKAIEALKPSMSSTMTQTMSDGTSKTVSLTPREKLSAIQQPQEAQPLAEKE